MIKETRATLGGCIAVNNGNSNTPKKTDDEYKSYGIALGLCFGAAFGVIFDQLAIGIGLGLAIGVAFDSYNKKK